MKNYDKYFKWFAKNLKLIPNYIQMIGLYGSIANNKPTPNDCDLFILTSNLKDEEAWDTYFAFKNNICFSFENEFNLRLNIITFSVAEMLEDCEFIKMVMQESFLIVYEKVIFNESTKLKF